MAQEIPVPPAGECRITLPKLTTEAWYKVLPERLAEAKATRQDVVLDASNVVWISPYGTVLLADFALQRIESGLRVSIQMPTHPESATYIRDSGLLRITQSSNLDDAIRIDNVQLRLLKRMEPHVPEIVANFASEQASNVDENEKALLRVWITELMTNANDHARSQRGFWICARYNPKNNDIRICVADSGIGIRQSLLDSKRYGTSMTHAESIEKALETGVTSRPGHTGGLGLKHITAYVKAHGGSLTIQSGDARAYIQRSTKNRVTRCPFYQGTIVTAAFDASTMEPFDPSSAAQSPFRFE